ncbi:MAG: hypothetical protein K1X83_00230 [Oligoflexia bacterium]|nr:hypothetical protein [Oligoflexia bacterium]
MLSCHEESGAEKGLDGERLPEVDRPATIGQAIAQRLKKLRSQIDVAGNPEKGYRVDPENARQLLEDLTKAGSALSHRGSISLPELIVRRVSAEIATHKLRGALAAYVKFQTDFGEKPEEHQYAEALRNSENALIDHLLRPEINAYIKRFNLAFD